MQTIYYVLTIITLIYDIFIKQCCGRNAGGAINPSAAGGDDNAGIQLQ